MPKGARTVAELDRAVAILHTRDATRARAIRALRGDVDRIEDLVERTERLERAMWGERRRPMTAEEKAALRAAVNAEWTKKYSVTPARRMPWPFDAPLSPAPTDSTPTLPRRIAGAAHRIARSFTQAVRGWIRTA